MIVSNAIMKKPLLVKLWDKYPKTWTYMLNLAVFWKYKTLNLKKLPRTIKLPSSHVLYINPDENRGRALLISDGVTQQRVSHFWKQAVAGFQPTLAIDVGVNYGECIFSTAYPKTTRVYGIEANPYLHSYIRQSQMAHYNREQITIIHAFASDHTSGQQTFYIDKNWSGTSSGIQLPNHRGHEQTNVSRLTIDSLFIHEDLNEQKLLFKIDVEGYEAFVLKGMQRLFKKCQHTFGIIEFDSLYMGKAGIQMDEFFSCLSDHFTVYVFKEDKQLIKMEELSLNWLQQYYNSNEIHTDLILTTNESELPGLGFTLLHSI